jgi:hypothetical protein
MEALRRADGAGRYGWFLEQGLGKTALAINDYVDAGDVDLNVVLAPSSFVADWPLAPAEWGVGFLRTGMWGTDEMPFDWEQGLYAISHETLRGSKRARDELSELFRKRRCMLTFDETTGIKNPSSLLAKYCISDLSKYAARVRELDGTPIVQNALDYWAKLRLLKECDGMNPYAFRNRFCVMGGYMGRQIKGIKNEDELAKILDRCSFRALKQDWRKNMPPKVDTPIHLEMTPNQQTHYRTMMEEFYALVGDAEINAALVLTQRMKLQQISSCMLMRDGKAHWIEGPKNNPKLKAALDVMNTGHGKTIIPYFFDPSGAMLFDEFTKAGLNPAWIHSKGRGGSSAGILEEKAKFNNDPSCRVILGQIDQLARGHTLLGQKGKDRCFRTYMYETSLSLMHVQQVSDRNHRGDQDETCQIYWPVASPIDQLNVDILTKKKTQAEGMDALVKAVRRRATT